MADQVVDLKKWEAAIFSGNANQSEEAYKILKDYISDKKPGNRKVSTFLFLYNRICFKMVSFRILF
jgi:hypothetical protein